jgi:hypothetical protein
MTLNVRLFFGLLERLHKVRALFLCLCVYLAHISGDTVPLSQHFNILDFGD